MKIVIVRREPGAALSMDVYTDNLVAELKKLRPTWQINEIAPRPWSDKDNLWRSGTGLRKYYERFWCHPQQVSQLNADLFHIIDHSNAHVAYWLKRMGKPIVVTCHDLVQFIYPEILKEQSRLPALSMAAWQFSVRGMLQSDAIVSVSSNTASDITKMLHIPPEQITVAFNGVDPQFQTLPETEVTALRQHYALSPQTVCLLNVGSNHQRKNILTVLQVLMVLKQRGLSVSLWKTGDNFTIEQQAFIRKHGLDPNILYLGQPSKEALMQIYNAADVLLAPSLYEGFGLTILEAMACGTSVVTSNVSSLPEVAGDAAILVNPTDVVAIADAVCQLQNDPSYRQQLINRGIARASQFTWQNTAQQVAQVYEAVLGRR